MVEQIVEYRDDINFAVKLDVLETGKVVISPKKKIGHLLWSIKIMKYNSSKHSRRRFIRYFVQFERQADGNPAEFKLDAYLDSCAITKPDRAPEHDYQYTWSCEPLRFESMKCDELTWHSEWRWMNLDALRSAENEFLDDQGRIHLWARVDIFELSNYGRADKPDLLTVNGRTFKVNKYILAGFSPFFRTFFFKDGFKEFLTQNFEIRDPEVDADMFGRMLDIIMTQDQYDPDDETVEGLLELADKYDIAFVKEFRMAETYGLVALKGQTVRRMDPQEFCSNFLDNVNEFAKLSDRSTTFPCHNCKKRRRLLSPDLRYFTTRPLSRSRTVSSTRTASIRSMSRSSSYDGHASDDDNSSIYHPPTEASFSA
uniref:BTB domain-containing protein n=1 Tax=Globodera rostochiensis TaxID=31243 RepID=A0A914HTK8_GLORO